MSWLLSVGRHHLYQSILPYVLAAFMGRHHLYQSILPYVLAALCGQAPSVPEHTAMCPGCFVWAGTICTRAYCHMSWLPCVGRHHLYQSILPCVLAALCGQAPSVPEHTAICPGCFVWAGTICTRAYCHVLAALCGHYWGCRRVDCNGCLAKFKGKSWFKGCQIQRLVLVQFTHKNVKMKGIVTKHYKTAKVWPRCL